MTDTLGWIMGLERTVGWLMFNRRLVKDYEEKTEHSEAFIQLAMIHLMVNNLLHIKFKQPLREFASDDFLQDFKKWYVQEDWAWMMEQLVIN